MIVKKTRQAPDIVLSLTASTFVLVIHSHHLLKKLKSVMSTQPLEAFYIIGHAVKTINQNGQSAEDLAALWDKFLSDNSTKDIPNRLGKDIYCVYTEYEGDHTKPYTAVLGHKVSNLKEVPKGLKGITVVSGNYRRFLAKGSLMEGAVEKAWKTIWSEPLQRAYSADFEVYGANAMDPERAEVEIFVGVDSD